MPYFKAEDNWYDNPKITAVGPLGAALYFAVLGFCNRNQSDGYIAKSRARLLLDFDGVAVNKVEGDKAVRLILDRMVAHGLLHEPGHECPSCLMRDDGGEPAKTDYLVHDYLLHQTSKAQMVAKAEATRKRVAAWRKKQVSNNAGNALPTGDVMGGVTDAVTGLKKEEGRSKKKEGGRGDVAADVPEPMGPDPRPHCSKHEENHEGPCRSCQRRREWDERHAVQSEIDQRRALKEARRACPVCDENGMVETPAGMVRCGEHGEAVL